MTASLRIGLPKILRAFAATTMATAALVATSPANAQEPASCLSMDPTVWPTPSKPYFMLAVDTSGSMISAVSSLNSCGFQNNVPVAGSSTRMGHAKCAVRNSILAFNGEVNFGLAQFASFMTGCGASCYGDSLNVPLPGCDIQCYNAELIQFGVCAACGPMDNAADPTTRRGGRVLVGMLQDPTWGPPPPPPPPNIAAMLPWVDNVCTSNLEVTNVPDDGPAYGLTPLNGILRDMRRYFQTGWTNPDNPAETFPTPLSPLDRPCRSVNVILLTDGDETCDSQAQAVAAAAALFGTGVTIGANTFNIKVYVINFAGGNLANTNAIAAAGGTVSSYFATNEVQLSQALSNIISTAIKPEVCNNLDDNCNGCTDEGYVHYCDQGQACCAWVTQAQRTTCINNYKASITPADPDGNLALLPCTTPAQQAQPANWLCFDPKETCDNVDNNCQGGVDEGIVKCGSPLACPTAEICDGADNDCDGLTDEGCPFCVPSPEICDGCDNDCDGIADDGIPPIPCGLMSPPNCVGQLTCKAPVAVPVGTCAPGGGYNNCSNNPQMEVCDMLDNDCDGVIDDGIAAVPCVPPMTPPGLVYGGTSQCQMGLQPCGGMCQGFIGPSAEICDGIDNDCDGVVDDGVPGIGNPCGNNQPPCTPGLTACVNGALVCQGGNGPQAEICDGIDNNCNGQVDEAPLADAPAPGMNGCWDLPGNCCSFPNLGPAADLTWCPPPNAVCNDNGSLQAPCNKGTLACAGASGWICQNANGPAPEACDGLDNDCNGFIDDGNIPQVGQSCGANVPPQCLPGVLACVAGVLDCVGDTPPIQELCNGLDDDCDGVIDNGIPTGGSCTPPYDMVAYPDTIGVAPCAPGVLQCDGNGGLTCVGGQGPTPEVCDGIDNDCDGMVDETGMPPNGIDGSQNPFPPPNAAIGDACGVDTGACQEGAYACLNGVFACIGGQGPQPEDCDCSDNDCDGVVDNPNPNDMPPLCGRGKDCVNSSVGCQCAEAEDGEFGCPPGYTAEQVTDSATGQNLGSYCVKDACGDCTTKTFKDGNGNVLCAPDGTPPDANCVAPPICQCKGMIGCQEPCSGVTCDPGSVCTSYGPKAGTCVVNKCFDVKCQGCDTVCTDAGDCADDPCEPNPCPGEACKPSADPSMFECFGSCADVDCPSGQKCISGQCEDTCSPACPDGQVCDEATDQCVDSLCPSAFCADGSCCDGLTGECHVCPCDAITCPEGQKCADGQCVEGGTGTGGAGGSGGQSAGAGGNTTGAGASGASGPKLDDRVFGLTTGGGGCACEATGSDAGRSRHAAWALAALALAVWVRRRTSDPAERPRGEVQR